MTTIELIYDRNCPHAATARKVLAGALAAVGLPPRWQEWDRESPASPPHARWYGSPTILVDGRDVAGDESSADANCCRVYPVEGMMRGAPPIALVVSALSGAKP